MQPISPADKARILDILCAAFDDNRSVNYIVGAAKGRGNRIRALMEYSLERCRRYGRVHLSADRSTCALVLYHDRKPASVTALALDLKLVFHCIGLNRLRKTLRRESVIKRHHPRMPFTYLWFIAVDPAQQGHGSGSQMLRQILEESSTMNRPVYLETSTGRNLPWYQRAGFSVFHEEDFGYPLYFLRWPER